MRLNGTEQNQIHSTNDRGSMHCNGYIDVTTVPWDLDVRLAHDSGGAVNFTVADSNLSVDYMGET